MVQLDDLDGEIHLASCVDVSDCETEKNYGLQIQVCATVLEYLIQCFGHCIEGQSDTPPPPQLPDELHVSCLTGVCVCVF